MPVPQRPKIYHIVHVDRLASIVQDGYLWCDRQMMERGGNSGTTIGINSIKSRRLELPLDSHAQLHVGDFVPFYFCPRSVMLFIIHKANHDQLSYKGGQSPIIHLEADLFEAVNWGNNQGRRWAFTSSNAGSNYFDDYADLAHLEKLDWDAITASQWSGSRQEGKQAEFLIEHSFPWTLFSRIGTHSHAVADQVRQIIAENGHNPYVARINSWYY